MAQPPPVPAASNPVPPPLFNFPFTFPSSGNLTIQAISFLTQFWASVQGDGGLGPAIEALQTAVATLIDQVATLFGMHGDGTIDADGVLTVTGTNGTDFGPFATGDDAADLTGTLAPGRIADGSLPYAKLTNAAGDMLLGAVGAGALEVITIGDGLVLSGGALVDEATIVTTVSGLPAQPYPAGRRRFVSDATVTTFASVVAGTGGNGVPVFSDGSAWRIG